MAEERLIEKINVDLNCDRKCELCEKFFLCENEIKWEMATRGRMHKAQEVMSQIKHKVAVAGGKGGVGKSAVAVNLATSLAMKGYKVSILDHDFDGPCVPKMLGVKGQRLRIGVTVQLINPSTKEIFDAKAEVCSIPERLPGADKLRVKEDTDYWGKGPKKLWAIKIIQKLGEEEEEELRPKVPKYAGRLGQRQG